MDNNNNKGKKLLERDGFYLVLFLCVCLVALTAVWVTKNSIDNLATENGFVNYDQGELIEDDKVASNEDEIHLIKDNEKSVPTSTNSSQNLEKAKEKLAQEEANKKQEQKVTNNENAVASSAIMPAEGTISREYSESEPSYSATLEQWELHKAIDIKTKEGTPVKSVMAGEISQITNDKNGITIKVKHSDDLVTVYSNLSSDKMVKVGEKVNIGDVISNVGNSSIIENADGPHLHFEVLKGGKNIDPLSIIK